MSTFQQLVRFVLSFCHAGIVWERKLRQFLGHGKADDATKCFSMDELVERRGFVTLTWNETTSYFSTVVVLVARFGRLENEESNRMRIWNDNS